MLAVLDDAHQRVTKVSTQMGLQTARQMKAHKGHVLQVLHIDIAHIGQKVGQRVGIQAQLQQARVIGVGSDLVTGLWQEVLGCGCVHGAVSINSIRNAPIGQRLFDTIYG